MAAQDDIERWFRENVAYIQNIRNATSFKDFIQSTYDRQLEYAETSGEGFKSHSAGGYNNPYFARDLTDEERSRVQGSLQQNPYSSSTLGSADPNAGTLAWTGFNSDNSTYSFAGHGFDPKKHYSAADYVYEEGFYNEGPNVHNIEQTSITGGDYVTKRIMTQEEFNASIDTEEFLISQEDRIVDALPFYSPISTTISRGHTDIFGESGRAIDKFNYVRSRTPEEIEAALQDQLTHDINAQKVDFMGQVARVVATVALSWGVGAIAGAAIGASGGKALAGGLSFVTGGYGLNPNDMSSLGSVAESVSGVVPRNISSTGVSLTGGTQSTGTSTQEGTYDGAFAASGNSDVFGEDVTEEQTGGSFLDV